MHDNNDFVVFIDLFFNQQPAADMGRQGGLLGSDGLFNNNDFVVFIDQFFAGC
ncbi:MAG: GC-type dockerin domain-anchored protein [Phycisphaerales bacterium]|nr:GC-type dockerin domain-anchored protein [Phycisphaerales bacterium]